LLHATAPAPAPTGSAPTGGLAFPRGERVCLPSSAPQRGGAVGEPRASRPHMPGYRLRGPDEGTGLLPWAWAEERLAASRNYWVVTTWPDGRPHTMPVWGIWDAGAVWFCTGGRSRKARNLAADPRCVVATEDALNPVVVEGSARI